MPLCGADAVGGDIDLLREALASIMESRGGLGDVQPMRRPRLVSDHSDKFMVLNRNDQRAAVVSLSPRSQPRKECEAAARASAARAALGERLGAAVLSPWHVGLLGGCCFSVTAYAPPISDSRMKRWWQLRRVRGPLLQWLLEATAQTARQPTASETQDEFLIPLEAVSRHPGLAVEIRNAATTAIKALDRGEWRPMLALTHNDLWLGNIHLVPQRVAADWGFAIIDWLGSRKAGSAIYDLVRLSMSLELSTQDTKQQIAAHSRALCCQPAQTHHYLLAALGQLVLNLGNWPEDRFVIVAGQCHQRLVGGLRT